MVDFMSDKTNTMGKIKKNGKKVAHNATFNPIVEIMARLGYAARGLIYFVMGLLTFLLAFGKSGKTTDQQGAIATIGTQSQGKILLWLIFIGLICYSLWGLIRAVLNPFHKEHDKKGNVERAGYLFSGIAYALLAIPTYALITGGAKPAHNGAQGVQIQQYVAKVLAMPMGQLMVGIIGTLVIVVGIFQVYQALRPNFDVQLHLVKLTKTQVKFVKDLGRAGTAARGIIIALAGIFIVAASYTANSNNAKGFDSTVKSLLNVPYGLFLMGIIAIGLISLGIYSLCVSLYFRLRKF